MLDRDSVLRRHEEMRGVRQLEEGDWDDNARLMAPDQSIRNGEVRRTRYDELFDSTQLYAVDNFQAGIFGQLTNPANRWIELGTEDPDFNAWQPMKAWLYSTTSLGLASLGPAVSSFYEEISPVYADSGVFGNGTLSQEEELGKGRIIDRALPLGQCYWDVDAHGEIDRFHREYELKGRQIKGWWGDVDKLVDDRTYKIVHSVWQNPDHVRGRLGPEFGRFCSVYCSPDLKELERLGGYYEMPFHTIRWKKRATSPYALGPGHVARADINMLQEMERSHLIAAQKAAEPTMLAHDDSVVNVSDIVPNAVLHGTISDAGKQLLAPLNTAGNLQLSMDQSKQRREAIREAFYFSQMLMMQRPQMTATEYMGYEQERLRQMGPGLMRVMRMLSGFTARRLGILGRAGQLPPPPPEFVRRQAKLQVIYQSPLAKLQQVSTARATLQFANVAMQLGQVDPEALDVLDIDGTLSIVHDGFGAAPGAMRSPEDIEKRRAARAQQQEQAVALEQTGQAVAIAAEAAHAQQAGTLAKARQL